MKYIKKPLIVEAFRYGHDPYPAWYIEALYNKKVIHKENIIGCSDFVIIKTLEGEMRAYAGDFIIKGIKGEIYPCKEDIFNKTYEISNINKLIEKRKQKSGKVEYYSIKEMLSMMRDNGVKVEDSETRIKSYRKMVDIFLGTFSEMLNSEIDDNGVYHLDCPSSILMSCILEFMNGDMKFIEVFGSDLIEEVNPTSVNKLRRMFGKEKLYIHSTKKNSQTWLYCP